MTERKHNNTLQTHRPTHQPYMLLCCVAALLISLWCLFTSHHNQVITSELAETIDSLQIPDPNSLNKIQHAQTTLQQTLSQVQQQLTAQHRAVKQLGNDFKQRLHSMPQPAINLLRYTQVATLVWDAALSLKQYTQVDQAIAQLTQAKNIAISITDNTNNQALIERISEVMADLQTLSNFDSNALVKQVMQIKTAFLAALDPPATNDDMTTTNKISDKSSNGWKAHLQRNLTTLSKIIVVKKQARTAADPLSLIDLTLIRQQLALLCQQLNWAIRFHQKTEFIQSITMLKQMVAQLPVSGKKRARLEKNIYQLGLIDLQPKLPDFSELVSQTLSLAASSTATPLPQTK